MRKNNSAYRWLVRRAVVASAKEGRFLKSAKIYHGRLRIQSREKFHCNGGLDFLENGKGIGDLLVSGGEKTAVGAYRRTNMR